MHAKNYLTVYLIMLLRHLIHTAFVFSKEKNNFASCRKQTVLILSQTEKMRMHVQLFDFICSYAIEPFDSHCFCYFKRKK